MNWFLTPEDAKGKIERWRNEYNTERPHSSLAYRTPNEYAAVYSELTSRMAAIPPARPSIAVNGTAVLAGKGSLTPCPDGHALDRLRAAVPRNVIATGGSGGMAKRR